MHFARPLWVTEFTGYCFLRVFIRIRSWHRQCTVMGRSTTSFARSSTMNVSPDSYPAAVEESSSVSGVSWGAIFAGAAGAAALSLILVLLGSGLGFSAMSPWANEGASAKTIGISTVVWLALTQIVASGLGGYLAGRLRVKWANMHG